MNIYIEIEVFNREFKSRLLVACFAAIKGFNVYLLSRSQIFESAINGSISPGLIFMKDANSTNYVFDKIEKIKKLGFKFVSQDEESGIAFEDFDDFIKRRFADGKTFKLLEFYFCWGKRDKKYLDKKFSKFTNFINTGSPRFDLLDNSLFNDYDEKIFFFKNNIKKKYILIPANISFPIGHRRIAESFYGFMSDSNEINQNWKEDFFFEKNLQQLTLLKYFIRLIRFLVSEIKEYEIILRPHPNERIEDWEKFLNIKSDHFKIIKKGSLSEFIYYSDMIIQNGCTSSLEAAIMKKKIISFEPIKFDNNFDKLLTNNIGIICSNNEDVKKTIFLDKKNNLENNLEELKYRCSFNSDNLAAINIVNYFDRISKDFKFKNNFANFKKEIIYNFLRFIKHFLLKYLGVTPTKSQEDKFPKFDIDEIRENIKNFGSINSEFSKILPKIISDKVLKISIKQ